MTNDQAELSDRLQRGLELLQPHRAKSDVLAGLRLIESASEAGLADASERRAIFESFAVGRPVHWQVVLDHIALAADQGSLRASEQLAIMAGLPSPAGVAPGEWHNVRNTISLERLFGSPQVHIASESPKIGAIEGFATAAECRWLIQCGAAKLEPSKVYDRETGGLKHDPKRINRSAYVNPLEAGVLAQIIRVRLAGCIGLPIEQLEVSQILHYAVGQEFKPHHDYLDPEAPGFQAEIENAGQRIATQIIYLNEEFEGGETQFPSLGLNYRGRTGDALIFFNINERGDPEPRTLHTGLPPTSGEKWIFSQWIRDRAPRAIRT